MDATRARFGPLLEWVIAVVCIVALVAIGSSVVRQFRTVGAVTPVIAHEATLPDPPVAVPSGAVSVPVLLLSGGAEIRVGDGADRLASLLSDDAETAPPSLDRTPTGERVTRFYQQGAVRFVIVLQMPQGGGKATIAGIYVQ